MGIKGSLSVSSGQKCDWFSFIKKKINTNKYIKNKQLTIISACVHQSEYQLSLGVSKDTSFNRGQKWFQICL